MVLDRDMNGAKLKILDAAEQLISEKGIKGTTISKIARKADVVDSHIYLYFKNKDDLLFAVADERLKEAHELMSDQLHGILDAKSRLSRIIWHSLRYNDLHPGFVRILFDCYTNKAFYQTPAYNVGRKIAGIIMEILIQGVSDGIFREDINMRIVQLIILGAIDFEAISCMMIGETAEGSKDLEDIMALLFPMIYKQIMPETEEKKSRILKGARKVFAEKGYTKTRISEIAEAADVGEATIYDYFKNKEDLLLSIPESSLRTNEDFLIELFEIKTPYRKLRRFLRYYLWLFLKDQDFLKVFISDIQLNKKFYSTKAYDNYKCYYQKLEAILEEGKTDGSFRPDINTRVFRNMFLGAFFRLALRWVVFGDKYSFEKLTEIETCINLFSSVVLPTK
jgi:TetR/AcrR family fatty acid metabolism transcriptional regulator